MSASIHAQPLHHALDLCQFIDSAPTPYHAVAEVKRRLSSVGFVDLHECDEWKLEPGGRYMVTRGSSSIVAWMVGQKSLAESGFCLIGAHTDSPNLRVKPNPDVQSRGYQQIGVEVYGGALHSTWLDRELSIAGRVLIQKGEYGVEERLVHWAKPVARIANLAIHLQRNVNSEGVVLNAQKHLVPICALGLEKMSLLEVLSSQLQINPEAIRGHDLSFYDFLGAKIGGMNEEFIFSGRLDNLASCHAAVQALVSMNEPVNHTVGIVLYDHEECGSRSAVGAAGSMLKDVVARIVDEASTKSQAMARSMSRSLLISADMAHAIHPNYAEQHESLHAPMLNQGLVIKSNANQSYATEGRTAAIFEGFCRAAGYTPQRFVVRSDLPCGSTIGPITAAQLGISTVDVGAPMLSMHSCREMAGTKDVATAIKTFRQAFLHYGES